MSASLGSGDSVSLGALTARASDLWQPIFGIGTSFHIAFPVGLFPHSSLNVVRHSRFDIRIRPPQWMFRVPNHARIIHRYGSTISWPFIPPWPSPQRLQQWNE